MKAENRAEFLADERKYLEKFPMTEEQRDAVMKRDLEHAARARRRLVRDRQARVHGQEVLSVHGVADGRRYRKRVRGDDVGGRTLPGRLALEVREEGLMAKIIAGIGTSHTPALGAAVDNGKHGRAVLDAVVQGLRAVEEVDGRNRSPTSRSLFTTITSTRSTSKSFRRSRSAAAPSSRSPTKAGARVPCRSSKGIRSSRPTWCSRSCSTSST